MNVLEREMKLIRLSVEIDGDGQVISERIFKKHASDNLTARMICKEGKKAPLLYVIKKKGNFVRTTCMQDGAIVYKTKYRTMKDLDQDEKEIIDYGICYNG